MSDEMGAGKTLLSRRTAATGILALCTATKSFAGIDCDPGEKSCISGGCEDLDASARFALRSQIGLAAQNTSGLPDTVGSSGEIRLDRTLGVVLANISYRFGVRPGFGFYDDSISPNAHAYRAPLAPGDQGTVLFGRALLAKSLAQNSYGDIFIMSICAHEFGHIVQYFSDYHRRMTSNQTTAKLLELHADFLAGYYIGGRGATYPIDALLTLADSWAAIGDTNYANPDHHGTPDERLDAIDHGYSVAQQRPEFSINDICEVGARYLGA